MSHLNPELNLKLESFFEEVKIKMYQLADEAERSTNHNYKNDPLDDIIKSFNERWFDGWADTPEEARIKVISDARRVTKHRDYETKVENNHDPQNSELALNKIMDEIMLNKRKVDLEEYKKWVTDESYRIARLELVKRMLDNPRLLGQM